MIYEYWCSRCDLTCDIIKPVSEFDREEYCVACKGILKRAVAPSKIYLHGTAVDEISWQPTFGKPMTDKELKAEAKRRGLVEVGNEDTSKHVRPIKSSYDDL